MYLRAGVGKRRRMAIGKIAAQRTCKSGCRQQRLLGQLKFRDEIERQKRNANIKQRRDFDPENGRKTAKTKKKKNENEGKRK